MSAGTAPTPFEERRDDTPPVPNETIPANGLCPRCGRALPTPFAAYPTCVPSTGSPPTVGTAPDPRDEEGTPFGPYRLLAELGHGGMGRVWKAWDPRLRRGSP